MNLLKRIEASLLDGQNGHPTGLVGRIAGEKMVRQHVPETTWTIELLNLRPEDQVLELGFGAGRAIELVTAQVPNGQVAGIDISREMVRSASRRNARAIKAGQVTLRHGDLVELPFADNQFDKIFSIQTFYFWPNVPRALAEIYRVLKPRGELVVTLSTGMTSTPQSTPEQRTWLEQYQLVLEEQVTPAMKQIGFTQTSIKQGPASRQFKTTAVVGVK